MGRSPPRTGCSSAVFTASLHGYGGAGLPSLPPRPGRSGTPGRSDPVAGDSRKPGDDPALPRVCGEVAHVIGRRAGIAAIPGLPGYPQVLAARRAQPAGRQVKIAAGTQVVALCDPLTLVGHSVGDKFAAAWPPRARWAEGPFCAQVCG